MRRLILILGGARSGKSSFAEKMADELGGDDVSYLATSQIKDEEMARRVSRHRKQRPQEWDTVEEEIDLNSALEGIDDGSVVLLDCLTLWISNLLLEGEELGEEDYEFDFDQEREGEILDQVEDFLDRANEENLTLIVVSNEVGQGLVPPYKLGRVYRDLVGLVNKLVASKAHEVYITYAGIPVEIKNR